ncbi:MAG: ATP-binding cassette domain-containing protein [Sciscionella sp.]
MASDTAPLVEFDGITTVRGGEEVFDGLRLRLEPGRITVLMGESGSGKTTLVRHLVGLLEPTVGTVRINSRNIWEMKDAELRRARTRMSAIVGGSTIVESSLFASLSVYDNVAYGLRLGAPDEDRVHESVIPVVRAFGLQDILEQPVYQLSAHTKRRVVLARALAADARLIVLDDIESGFDSRYTEKILDVLGAARSRGTSTFLITTHDPKLGRLLADEVAVLAEGKIVAYGPPDVVLDGIRTASDFHRCFGFSDNLVSAAAGGGASVRAEVAEFLLAREGKRPWPQVAPSTAWFVIGALVLLGLVALALLRV